MTIEQFSSFLNGTDKFEVEEKIGYSKVKKTVL